MGLGSVTRPDHLMGGTCTSYSIPLEGHHVCTTTPLLLLLRTLLCKGCSEHRIGHFISNVVARYKVCLSTCCRGNRCSYTGASACQKVLTVSTPDQPLKPYPSLWLECLLIYPSPCTSRLPLAAASLTDLKSSDDDDVGDGGDDDIAFPLCIVNLENCSRLRKLPKCKWGYQMLPDHCPSIEAYSEFT